MPALSVIEKQRTPVPQWVKDSATGYLYRDIKSGSVGLDFTLERKVEFVASYEACFPDLTAACESVGISKSTFFNHIKLDPVFAEDIKEIRLAKADKVESVLFQVALQPKPAAFMDRIAFLRAYRPELYTEKRINLSGKDLDSRALEAKSGTLGQVIDSELIDSGTPRPVIGSQDLVAGSQEPRSVTVSQEDSKILAEKKSQNQ